MQNLVDVMHKRGPPHAGPVLGHGMPPHHPSVVKPGFHIAAGGVLTLHAFCQLLGQRFVFQHAFHLRSYAFHYT